MKKFALALVLFPLVAGAQLWQNDFSTPTDWLSADLNAGTDAWVISNAAIGGDVDSIASASAGNGFAQFNSDGQCASNHQDVTLTYFQPIDISAYELSYLQFVQHYKRKTDTVYVEFSNDGLVWESIRINQDMWYYQQSDDPVTVRVSVPASVQFGPFWLRFRYSGECGFAWLMDDLGIYEKQQYALKANGRLTEHGFDYTEIAYCFPDSVSGAFLITNFGFDTLTDVIIKTDIYRNSLFEATFQDTIEQINPNSTVDYVQQGLIIGPYTNGDQFVADFTFFQSTTDTVALKDSIQITYDNTGRHDNKLEGYYLSNDVNMGVGNMFVCSDFFCPVNCDIYIPDDPMLVDQIVWLSMFKLNSGIWEYSYSTNDYNVQSGDLGDWLAMALDYNIGGPIFEPGDTGLVFYMTYGGDYPIPYTSRDHTGNYFYTSIGTLVYDPEGHSAMVRMSPHSDGDCLNCWEGIEENSENRFLLVPNPANTHIEIHSNIQKIESLKILSIDGREILLEYSVTETTLDIDFLSPGTYLLFLENENGVIHSEKFVKL
jgi:hypothetical protein